MTPRKSLTERFWPMVDKTDTCWLWIGYVDKNGYGVFQGGPNYKSLRAHRWAYEDAKGQVPEGLVLDHLCRVRHCVNPAHLEAVTNRENVMRGDTMPARNAARTHCPQGHEYTPDNIINRRTPTPRSCKACNAQWRSRYRARKRAEARAAKAAEERP